MKLVTVATKSERYYPYLKLSAERYGHELITLGWGQKWQGFTWRLKLITEYLKTCKEDEIICIIDGYDVLILEGPKEIEEKFKKICNGDKSKVVISKETLPNNIISEAVLSIYQNISWSNVDGYYLCAGTYIGYSSSILNMYKVICDKNDCFDNENDQILLQSYAAEYKNSYIIDKDNNIFLVMCDFFNGLNQGENGINITNETFFHNSNKPSILHAYGNASIDNIIKHLGYNPTLYTASTFESIDYLLKSFAHYIPILLYKYIFNILFIFILFFALLYLYNPQVNKYVRKIIKMMKSH